MKQPETRLPLDTATAADPGRLPHARRFRISLQVRLLFVFLLVGLLPMFFAAELTSQVVTHAFENNLKTWLHETSNSSRYLSTMGAVRGNAARTTLPTCNSCVSIR